MGNVYFLGAGFSAAYGLPIMNEFFTFAKRSRLIEPEEKRFLAEVQRFAHMGVRLVTISRNNMEEILSFLEMAEQADQIPQRIKDLSKIGQESVSPRDLLRSIIAKVYGPLPESVFTPELRQCFIMTFGLDGGYPTSCLSRVGAPRSGISPYIIKPPQFTVITTNYDLCLESQLLRVDTSLKTRLVGNWISTGGNPQGRDDQSCIYDPESHATLLRLHGAINWNSADGLTNGNKYEFRVMASINPKNNLPWAIDSDPATPNATPPIIVAPTVLKHQADDPYGQQWQAAAKALAEARQLIFIGYSFPESDAYMRYFLGASLAENVDLESIHIVDPQANTITEKLRSDNRYGAHFLDMLCPHNRRWEAN